ncbi:MAG: hypothetical protein KAZ88_12645 [Acidimicrobiia bacterium]|nr:hypothetical protein [Acidimicrobiia bacterium]
MAPPIKRSFSGSNPVRAIADRSMVAPATTALGLSGRERVRPDTDADDRDVPAEPPLSDEKPLPVDPPVETPPVPPPLGLAADPLPACVAEFPRSGDEDGEVEKEPVAELVALVALGLVVLALVELLEVDDPPAPARDVVDVVEAFVVEVVAFVVVVVGGVSSITMV